ncbi:P-loop containing nucleoside triphosphate hydrolase protein [Polychaeton citri CBS 116435]|uniref:P-loop containing nucleoside triphosphate hydrolase protein n=1 Tax=Polychaeton citri CBS 116435 TaxID=1314669 RepID=A0A9P4UL91_9PEZI|nr:P-loop containing nucleoside triphosphate hydrolase protein [Polychaeton citri CBS 116435]
MSNDVQEIYSLVSWIAPGYLGDKSEFSATYGRPIEQGTYKESTAWEKRKSLKRLAVLREQIEPKVNRADITVLRGSLKSKVEYVITVPLSELQVAAYNRFLNARRGLTGEADAASDDREAKISQVELFSWLALLGLLTAHPLCFKRKLLSPPTQRKDTSNIGQGEGEGEEEPGDEHVFQLGFSEKAVNYIVSELTDSIDPLLSAKTSNLLAIVNLSIEAKDKILVFSSSIPTLTYLGELFSSNSIPFGRIDGSVLVTRRIALIEAFHNNEFDLLLISTRAGGVGLNIQGANRVVIFDFGFNPMWEEQAVGRAYRLGQEKHVYVYRFMAGGTFETNVYNKQLFKSSLAQRVVDKKNPARNAQRTVRDWLYEPKDLPQKDLSQWVGKDAQVLDVMINRQMSGAEDLGIRSIQTMETLHEDAEDEPLTAEERAEVLREIEDSRNRVFMSRRIGVATQVPPPGSRPPASAPTAEPPRGNFGARFPSTAHAMTGN